MPVNYVLVERHNPLKPTAPRKLYAVAKSTGETNLKKISKDISSRSTVNSSDTLAVLDALVQQLIRELAEGRIVRIGDLGTFQVSVSGEGVEAADLFNNALIKKSRIIFRPGADLKDMLATVSYRKV